MCQSLYPELLKLGRLGELDIVNSTEELEAMSELNKTFCRGYVAQIITNKLRIDYWPSEFAEDKSGWFTNIQSLQVNLRKYLPTTSISNYLKQKLEVIYNEASKATMYEDEKGKYSNRALSHYYPLKCPYTLDEIIGK